MTNKTDFSNVELARTVRTRVRLPEAMAPTRLFQGWGPTV
jgi:hypothetical protein